MLDRKQNLNKKLNFVQFMKARKLAEAKRARRIKASKTAAQKDTSTAPQTAATRAGIVSHLTDTEALTRKVREDMVKDAQAAFAAVMAELNASQTSRPTPEEIELEMEAEVEFDLQADRLKA